MVFLLFWLALSIAVGLVATSWGRSGGLWFVGSVLLTPILMGIFLLLAGEADDESNVQGFDLAKHNKVCPDCAEKVRVQARVCKHCGHEWTDAEVQENTLQVVRKYNEPLFYCADSSKVVSALVGGTCSACGGDVYGENHTGAEDHFSRD